MPMVSSGPISLGGNATTGGLNQSVNIELGRSATATINMNESAVRTLFAVPSGAISMSNGYGKSNRVTAAVTLSTNTTNYTVDTSKASGYVAGSTDFTLTINSGVVVYSTSTGSYALNVDTSWAAGDTVTIVNNGVILGCGGNGGSFGGGGGGSAGPALRVQRAITMNNLNRIAGGGGGGGGGGNAGQYNGEVCFLFSYGGGGGGGIGNGSGGGGGPGGYAYPSGGGGSGTLTAPGGGGGAPGIVSSQYAQGGTGGTGGSYGSAGATGGSGYNDGDYCQSGGASGGAAGACIVGNSFITYTNTGTRNGSIS